MNVRFVRKPGDEAPSWVITDAQEFTLVNVYTGTRIVHGADTPYRVYQIVADGLLLDVDESDWYGAGHDEDGKYYEIERGGVEHHYTAISDNSTSPTYPLAKLNELLSLREVSDGEFAGSDRQDSIDKQMDKLRGELSVLYLPLIEKLVAAGLIDILIDETRFGAGDYLLIEAESVVRAGARLEQRNCVSLIARKVLSYDPTDRMSGLGEDIRSIKKK